MSSTTVVAVPPGERALIWAANALLAARATALEKRKDADIAVLRGELIRLGVVVREEMRRQYWRLVDA